MDDIEKHVVAGIELGNGDFSGQDLSCLNLRNAKFRKSGFTGAQFYDSSLRRADLREAILIDADLRQADLQFANLTGANLTGANLQDAGLEDAILTDCIGIFDAGTDPRGYRFVGVKQTDGDWMVKAGCRWFSIGDAVEHWTDKDNQDALDRVDAVLLAALKP